MGNMNLDEITKSVLALMLDPAEAPNIAAELLPEDIHYPDLRAVYIGMLKVYGEGRTIDLPTIAIECGQKIKTVMDIAGFAPFARGNAQARIDLLKAERAKRELKAKLLDAANRLESEPVESVSEEIIAALQPRTRIKAIAPKEAAAFALETYMARKDRRGNIGTPTGYAALDRAINGGLTPGFFWILAAQTKKGKSAFAANLIRKMAIGRGVKTLLLNTELSPEEVAMRFLSILSGIDFYKIATGQASKEENQCILDAIEHYSGAALWTLNVPDLNLSSMSTLIRQHAIQHGIQVVFVDYIGRIDTQDAKLQEYQVLRLAAKRLKTLAQQLGIAIIMLAQITDGGTLEGAKAMRNESDLYTQLTPLDGADAFKGPPGFNYALVIELNRSGPAIKIPLNFYPEILTFVDIPKN